MHSTTVYALYLVQVTMYSITITPFQIVSSGNIFLSIIQCIGNSSLDSQVSRSLSGVGCGEQQCVAWEVRECVAFVH